MRQARDATIRETAVSAGGLWGSKQLRAENTSTRVRCCLVIDHGSTAASVGLVVLELLVLCYSESLGGQKVDSPS